MKQIDLWDEKGTYQCGVPSHKSGNTEMQEYGWERGDIWRKQC